MHLTSPFLYKLYKIKYHKCLASSFTAPFIQQQNVVRAHIREICLSLFSAKKEIGLDFPAQTKGYELELLL